MGGAQVSTAPQWGVGKVEVCSGKWRAKAYLGDPPHMSLPEAFGGLPFHGHGKKAACIVSCLWGTTALCPEI